ncbi:MAG TPA: hypothetical protein VFB13_05465 [Reyranella sp.]|jgi:hypothetical protein|nr:hypothetical protein [Reyranella sp.]
MLTQVVRVALLAAFLLLSGLSASQAGTYEMALGQGRAGFTFPDDWKVNKIKRGLEGLSRKQEVAFWIEACFDDELAQLQKEHDKYFADHKVAFSGKVETSQAKKGGATVTTKIFDAKYKGANTMVVSIVADFGLNKAKLIYTEWATTIDDYIDFDEQVGAIMKSFKFPL